MNGAFYIGATGLEAQQRALDAVADNIANLNTLGFKRSRVSFTELMSAPTPDTDVSAGQAGPGAAFSGVEVNIGLKDYAQGDLRQTGSPLDLAIDGKGFIELLGPGGRSYLWRGGSLIINADGYLAAGNGMPLRALISVPRDAGDVSIGYDGAVRNGAGDEIGHIDLVRVDDETSLLGAGEGLYAPANELDLATSTPGEDGAGVLVQGAVESSNVKLTDEMVSLMLMQRAFAANAQVVQAGDQLMSIINGLRR